MTVSNLHDNVKYVRSKKEAAIFLKKKVDATVILLITFHEASCSTEAVNNTCSVIGNRN